MPLPLFGSVWLNQYDLPAKPCNQTPEPSRRSQLSSKQKRVRKTATLFGTHIKIFKLDTLLAIVYSSDVFAPAKVSWQLVFFFFFSFVTGWVNLRS